MFAFLIVFYFQGSVITSNYLHSVEAVRANVNLESGQFDRFTVASIPSTNFTADIVIDIAYDKNFNTFVDTCFSIVGSDSCYNYNTLDSLFKLAR